MKEIWDDLEKTLEDAISLLRKTASQVEIDQQFDTDIHNAITAIYKVLRSID